MRLFGKQLGTFLVVLALVFIGLEIPIQLNYSKKIHDYSDWQCLDDINAEILIVGNSRIESGFDPSLIEKSTGLSTFLLTQSGWRAPLLKRKLTNYLEVNKAPLFLIVQADPIHLDKREDWHAKKHFLKYLFLDRENIAEAMQAYEGYHHYEFLFPFIRYRGYANRYVRDALGIPMKLEHVKGYLPLEQENRQGPIPFDTCSMTPGSVAILGEFYQLSPNSKKIGVYPLVSKELYSRIFGLENLMDFCASQQIDLLNANDLILEKPDSIFYDHSHANIRGALLQTELLIDHINALQRP